MELVNLGKNFARYQFGDVVVIALSDGYVDMPTDRLREHDDQPFEKLPKQVKLVNGKLRLSVNAFLIVDAGHHFLIDTGASNTWRGTMGLLSSALREANVARDDIVAVGLTHTHQDHVSGLIASDGSEAFPNLKSIFVPQEEIAVLGARRYAALRGRCVPVGQDHQITDRIKVCKAIGHSPGHMVYEIKSTAGLLLVWGDIVHVPSIQFSRPELTWALDDNQAAARHSRERMLQRAIAPDVWVAGAHLDFPGVGRVEPSGNAYTFVS